MALFISLVFTTFISILNFIEKISPPITLIIFQETDHFFHGKLIELKTELIMKIREALADI